MRVAPLARKKMAARATRARVRLRKLPICHKEDILTRLHPSHGLDA
jgi:hypothetical protein